MQQVGVLTVDVAEDLDGRLELDEGLLLLEYSRYTLDQKLNHFTRQLNDRHVLRVLGLVEHDVVVEVVDDDVHDEARLLGHHLLRDCLRGLLELPAPFFGDFQSF